MRERGDMEFLCPQTKELSFGNGMGVPMVIRMSTELIEIFEKLSVKIAEIYDEKLSGEITDVHEDLVSSTVKAIGERNELEGGGTGTS